MKIKEVSVFFPAYNEEGNIEKTVLRAKENLDKHAEKYEIIVVNDCSTDKTKEIVESLVEQDNRIRMVSHEQNMGYGHAIRTGFKECKYEWICYTDSDGQFDFSEFPDFVKKQEETNADLVISYYRKRKVPISRKLNTFIWQTIVRILFGLKVKSIDCAFKLIRKSVIDKMKLTAGRGAFITTEFLVKAKEQKAKIVQIPVNHFERKEGQSTGADLKVILNSFKDLYQLKKRFLLFAFVGFTSALISLLIFNFLLKFNMTFNQSIIIGTFSSAIYNFFMNRNLTFSAGGTRIKKQIGKYLIVYLVAQGIHIVGGMMFKSILGGGTFESNLAVLGGIALSIPFSFFGSLLWTFKKKGQEKKLFGFIEKKKRFK